MTDVKVEQCDEVIAKQIVKRLMRAAISEIGQYEAIVADLVARHRQAAEKAQQERDAAYIEGRVEHYQAKIDKTNPDDVDLIEMRQHTVEALEVIATAIRSQNDG